MDANMANKLPNVMARAFNSSKENKSGKFDLKNVFSKMFGHHHLFCGGKQATMATPHQQCIELLHAFETRFQPLLCQSFALLGANAIGRLSWEVPATKNGHVRGRKL